MGDSQQAPERAQAVEREKHSLLRGSETHRKCMLSRSARMTFEKGKFRLSVRKSFLTVRCMHWSHPAGEALEASSLGLQGLSWRKAASPGKALQRSRACRKSRARLALIMGGLAQR